MLIWSPVISAQLNGQRRVKSVSKHRLDKMFNSVEDVKLKVRQNETLIQGRSVQITLKLEILCLLQDEQANMQLVTWNDQFNEKVPLTEFDNAVNNQENLQMRFTIANYEGFGELQGREIQVEYYIDYSLLAVKEQIIEISPSASGETAADSLKAALAKLESEVASIENENGQLRRQLFFYERDITSLKRGLWKAENRNSILSREKKEHQALIEKLQCQSEPNGSGNKAEYYPGGPAKLKKLDMSQEDNVNLGSRIKRMFMNSL